MAQLYTVLAEHSAVLPGLGPTRIYGGTVISDATYSITDLVAAGFVLVPHVAAGGNPAFVLTPAGWTYPSGGGAPTTRIIGTTAPLAGGGDLSADRTLSLGIDSTLQVSGGVLGVSSLLHPTIMRPMWCMPGQATSIISIGSTQCVGWYAGRAPKALTTVDVLNRIPATVMTGTTWCELAIAKGTAPVYNSGATLTVVGYYSTGSSGSPFNSTGNKLVTVTVSPGQSIAAGDHVWLVFAKLSTGSPSFRAAQAADELVTGQVVDAVGSTRPSLILGTPTLFPIPSPNPLPMVFYLYV